MTQIDEERTSAEMRLVVQRMITFLYILIRSNPVNNALTAFTRVSVSHKMRVETYPQPINRLAADQGVLPLARQRLDFVDEKNDEAVFVLLKQSLNRPKHLLDELPTLTEVLACQ
jgi:hypothetical protein